MKDPNRCPKCGSLEVNFEPLTMLSSEQGFFNAYCDNCDFEGRQWNKVKFDRWQERVDEGEYEDIK